MFCATVTKYRVAPGSRGTNPIWIEMAKVRRKPSDTHHITAVRMFTAWSPR
jgi:hypothetical protein